MLIPEGKFCFPQNRLENDRLILEPFDFSRHAELFVKGCKDHTVLFAYVPQGPFQTVTDFYDNFYGPCFESSETRALYTITAKSGSTNEQGEFAGTIGLAEANPANGTIEMGYIVILPRFQHTFVTSNAIGLLLLYVLDPPPDGLGLRRCQWQSHAKNEASRRVATKMLFMFEGVERFERVVPADKVSNGVETSQMASVTRPQLGPSRDAATFAHYCDTWPELRPKVIEIIGR